MKHEFNRSATIDIVLEHLMEHLPTATEDNEQFLKDNKRFVDQLFKKSDISTELAKFIPKLCPKCSGSVTRWLHKTKNSFIVSLGDIKKVTIPVKHCLECNFLLYPELCHVGLLPLHHKERIMFLIEESNGAIQGT